MCGGGKNEAKHMECVTSTQVGKVLSGITVRGEGVVVQLVNETFIGGSGTNEYAVRRDVCCFL